LKRGLSLILSARLPIQAFHRKAEWKRFQIMAILAIMAIPAIVAIRRAMFAADVFPIEDRRKRWAKIKAVTLVMLQPPTPAREPTAWMHVPSQPLMRSLLSQS
jgi:hypothetical protein